MWLIEADEVRVGQDNDFIFPSLSLSLPLSVSLSLSLAAIRQWLTGQVIEL